MLTPPRSRIVGTLLLLLTACEQQEPLGTWEGSCYLATPYADEELHVFTLDLDEVEGETIRGDFTVDRDGLLIRGPLAGTWDGRRLELGLGPQYIGEVTVDPSFFYEVTGRIRGDTLRGTCVMDGFDWRVRSGIVLERTR